MTPDIRRWPTPTRQWLAPRLGDGWAIVGLLAIGVATPAVLAVASGATDIPHNDDWSYRRFALTLFEYGRLEYDGWGLASIVGMALPVQPLLWLTGGAAWAFGLLTAAFATVGTVAGYLLARRMLPPRLAVLAVASMIFCPGYLRNVPTFMTDVPTVALMLGCLALGAIALEPNRAHRHRWLVASMAVGVWAFSVREIGLVAPLAVLAAGWLMAPNDRRSYVYAAVAVLAVCGLIYFFLDSLPGRPTPPLQPFSAFNVNQVRRTVATLTLALLPTMAIGIVRWWPAWRRPEVRRGAVVGVLVAELFYGREISVLVHGLTPPMFVGNEMTFAGILQSAVLAGARPALFDPTTWAVINVVALASAVAAFAIAGGAAGSAVVSLLRGRRFDAGRGRLLLGLFALFYGGGIVGWGLLSTTFDRYLWPLALVLPALLLYRSGAAAEVVSPRAKRTSVGAAALAMSGMIAISLALALNSFAFDSARWHMGELAVSQGFAPETVDAGFEWVGAHSTEKADLPASGAGSQAWSYRNAFPSFRLCALVSSSVIEDPAASILVVDEHAYKLLLVAGPDVPLFLYRVIQQDCP